MMLLLLCLSALAADPAVESAPGGVADAVSGVPATDLLAEAWRRIERGDWEGARIVAEQAMTREPSLRPEAIAAIAASHEVEGWPERALPLYEQALALADGELVPHLHFRVAETHAALGQYEQALASLDALGAVHERLDLAKIAILRAIWTVRAGDPDLGPLADALATLGSDELPFYQAQARATIAAALCERAANVAIVGSGRRQARSLVRRIELIRRAEQQVAATLQLEEPEWALEGLLVLGGAYERIADDLREAPVPRKVRHEPRRALYEQGLAERTDAVYVKAARHYEQGIELAIRLNWHSRRAGQLQGALEQVLAKVDARAGREKLGPTSIRLDPTLRP